jgi:hypothetical protein
MYYGRARLTGEWYIALDCTESSPERIAALAQEARNEGQQIVWHPYGPLMFPLDWLAEGTTDPKLLANYESLKAFLENFSPLSRS